jgi:iron complex transport system substrate-binding protein
MSEFSNRFLIILITSVLLLAGCGPKQTRDAEVIKIVDQLGRRVEIPRHMTRIAALYHFGGGIVYALGQQDKLVEQSLYGQLANALSRVDPKFAAKQKMSDGHSINYESIIALRPQCAIVYSSFTTSEMEHLEGAGIRVIAVKGETLEESFLAVRLIAKILECEDNKKLIPATAFLGGTFLLLMDTVARTIWTSEIPISIVTSFIGAPFLGYLVVSKTSTGASGEPVS